MSNNKLKIILFILLIIVLVFIVLYSIFGTSLSFLDEKEIKESRKEKIDLINTLKINNVETIYDKNNNIYYYNISEKYENNVYLLNLELEDGYKYKLLNQTLNIIKVKYNELVDVIIYNDKYYYETKIQLTNLPLINIETSQDITRNDTNSIFTYINQENVESKVTNNIKIHIRGASSLIFDKKSYKINFYNKNYTDEKSIYISDFYYGDGFILDAVYRDPSKIRNVLATNLWNDISNDFNNIDMNYEFVELFINNEYKGLYVFTEPVNRKKLNLNKSNSNDTSIIVKSGSWNMVTNDLDFKNISDDAYLEYELKYPNDNDLFIKSWDKILSKLSNYYSNEYTYDSIKDTWNLQNYIDIIIYNTFIDNEDNFLIKNNYFYMKSINDDEVYIQPWDMEYSFGLIYNSNDEKLIYKNMDNCNEINLTKNNKPIIGINDLLIDRYWELRQSILTKKYFDELLDRYKDELSKGVTNRDSNLWYEYDIEAEIEEIRIWIYNRLEYFDNYIKDLENE